MRLVRLLREAPGLKSWQAREGERDLLIKDLVHAGALGRSFESWRDDQAAARTPVLPGVVPFRPVRGVASGLRLVRSWVAGDSLEQTLERGPLEQDAALELAAGMLRALRGLHARDVLHRNLRPGNVILGNRGPVLVDLGLAAVADPSATRLLRTPSRIRYLSPEQTGALSHGIDARTDLHAVGLVLWEALTGTALQQADGLQDLIRSQLRDATLTLSRAPAALEGVLRRLVHPDPRERYQTADAALSDVEELLRGLAAGEDDPTIELGASDLRSSLAEPALAGRKTVTAQLTRTVQDLAVGRGGLVALSGRTGSGRSRLLAEVARRAEAQDLALIHVRASGETGSLALLDAVGGRLDQLDLTLSRRSERRTVLLVDDAERLSHEEAKVLEGLAANPLPGLLAVLTLNRDELTREHPLASLPSDVVVALPRLSQRATRQLLGSMGGQLPAALVERIVVEADGSPWMAVELLRGCVEEGALTPGPDGWRAMSGGELQPSRKAAALFLRRLERLSRATRDFLEAVAILGAPYAPELAGSLVDLDPTAVRMAVAEAVAAQLVRLDGDVRLVHASLQDVLLDELDDGERVRLHLAAGELLEARRPDDVLALARHFERAGRPRRALGYAMAAGRLARQRGALGLAEGWFAQVLAQPHLLGRDDELEANRALADLAVARGRLSSARERLHTVLGLLANPLERDQVELQLADVDALAGDLDGCRSRADRVLRDGHTPEARLEALGRLALVAFLRGRRRTALVLHVRRWWHARGVDGIAATRVAIEHAAVLASLGLGRRATRILHGLPEGAEVALCRAVLATADGRLEEAETTLAGVDRVALPSLLQPLLGVLEGVLAALSGRLVEARRCAAALPQPSAAAIVHAVLNEPGGEAMEPLIGATVFGHTLALRQEVDALEHLSVWRPAQRRTLLRRARRRRARVRHVPPVLAPWLAALTARLEALAGRHTHARRALDRALDQAEGQGARLAALHVLDVRGRLGEALDWPGAAADQAQARGLRRTLEGTANAPTVRATLSLVERFEGVLAAGHRLASELDGARVVEAVVDEAMRLLRPECCAVVGAEAPYELLAGDRQALVGAGLVRAALEADRAVLAFEDGSSSFGDSVALAGARSALAVAIRAEDRPVAVLVAAHRRLDGVFRDEERQLAGYLATLAGAAVENGDRFAQLQELRRSLEQRVEERTVQLEEAQQHLIHSAKMAAVGTLVAGLSHELNNPMSVILGWSQVLLAKTPEGDPRRRALHNIERESRRCAGLVQSLLDFSRKTPGERTRLDLTALLNSVAEIAGGPARRRGVVLTADVYDLPPVDGCAAELESTLLNLVTNAIDATPKGGSVTITAVTERDGVEVRVTDTGEGVPAELRERIFEPFFTTKAVGKGTGLGLALAQRFVEAHGGHLRCESQRGNGTTMSLWLPLTATSEVA